MKKILQIAARARYYLFKLNLILPVIDKEGVYPLSNYVHFSVTFVS